MIPGKPLVVAVCGPDGAGKSTQARQLYAALKEEGKEAVLVRPVYEIVERLPQPMRRRVNISPRQQRTGEVDEGSGLQWLVPLFALPYAIATVLLIRILYWNQIVVCDRYVYQFVFDAYGRWASPLIHLIPGPTNGAYLSVSDDERRERMTDESDQTVNRQYYDKVRKVYIELVNRGTLVEVSADGSVNETHRELRTVLLEE